MEYKDKIADCIRAFERYEFERHRNLNRMRGGIPPSFQHQDICFSIAVRQYNLLVDSADEIKRPEQGSEVVNRWRNDFFLKKAAALY